MAGHCEDCGFDYGLSEADHNLMCEAKTCEMCLVTYSQVVRENDRGERVCQDCRDRDGVDDGALYSSEEESEDE